MAGLVSVIHVFARGRKKFVDARTSAGRGFCDPAQDTQHLASALSRV